MGNVTFGIPRQLALALKAKHGINDFVETGTLVGHTAQWAAAHFHKVTTVDVCEDGRATEILNVIANVRQIVMDSSAFLESAPPDQPTLFWLDAHTNETCPVMTEIALVNRSALRHVILVDDVNQFGVLKNWPTKAEAIKALEDGGRRTVYEFEDVLVAEPCP